MASIEHIHQALLAERDAIRRRGLTFADLVTQIPSNNTTENTWDHIELETLEIQKVLLQQRAYARNYKGSTLNELVAQQNNQCYNNNYKKQKHQMKNVEFTPEEKAAYKARKTSQALAHCQREREKAIFNQKAAGFQL